MSENRLKICKNQAVLNDFEIKIQKIGVQNQKFPNFALGQMIVLSETQNPHLQLFSKQDERRIYESIIHAWQRRI